MDYKPKEALTSDQKADFLYALFTNSNDSFNLPDDHYDKLGKTIQGQIEETTAVKP